MNSLSFHHPPFATAQYIEEIPYDLYIPTLSVAATSSPDYSKTR